jgi:hypothetical protein
MLLVSGYLRLALLWAMIPLTVFASRPVTGCTCASGEYKFSCAAHLFHGHVRSDSNEKCAKPCCRQSKGGHSTACCQKGHSPLIEGQGTSGGEKCCNPDMLTALSVASSVTLQVDNDHHVLFDLPMVESGSVLADTASAHLLPHDTGPPGGDLIISLRRLLV